MRQKYARSRLHAGQVNILDLVYTYRFVSRQLVAESLGVNQQNGLHKKLNLLITHGYLNKRFDKRLKLSGVPAAYYLTPKGLGYLQGLPGHEHITAQVVKGSYRNKTVGQPFINHTLAVYRYTNLLKRHYPGLKVFTRRDMSCYSYFPSQLPDAFLSLPSDNPKQPKRFFFDVVDDRQPRSALDRRLATYCQFFEEGGWDETGSELPIVLLLCEWGPDEKRAQRSARVQSNRSLIEDLLLYSTTTNALLNMNPHQAIWSDVTDSNDTLELTQMP